ncbi:LOW QUALITY PROTEIN: hypothetical protein OSB04_012252 [Centaurea solstitialis]|uniref:GAG-pre-integrase domain-containing protein n=1 Tax=Centaurea solstitialis TaxID=347529 RepID=A0AA38TB25_9ASTR|nr:LOW QUALITY PROTEIN: hypothetical protein OSB04_012252 [Centaurea solstitialis]
MSFMFPILLKFCYLFRRLTSDNNISIEFDPLGFDVKDFQTQIPILRCNSEGDLYPFTSSPSSQQTPPSTFVVISQDFWHHRLGHPGSSLLRYLKNSSFINCGKLKTSKSCVFGKHIRLSFMDSTSCTYFPFDIVHSDLWTSPIISSGGHRYIRSFS